MKRNLFTIGAALLFGFGAMAQATIPDGVTKVTSGVSGDNFSVLDASESVATIQITDALDGFDFSQGSWQGNIYGGSSFSGSTLTLQYDGSKFNAGVTDNWSGVSTQFIGWSDEAGEDGTGPVMIDKFYSTQEGQTGDAVYSEKPMVVRGTSVDLSNPSNAYMEFDYTLTSNQGQVVFQLDLRDILGRVANTNETDKISRIVGSLTPTSTPVHAIITWDPDASDYDLTVPTSEDFPATTVVDNKLVLTDSYSPKFFDVTNPWESVNAGATMRSDRIIGFDIALFPDKTGLTATATMVMTNIKLGGKPASSAIKTVNGAELQVVNGVVYSAGQIVVTSITGQVVAVANASFDTNTLKGGVYVIKAAEGSAKIVK
ncbi:MAG: hypothetical protein LBU90_07980 [Bacteroidales bacterium]|jgi:hypothetical protein|nr:hypothetical protein [Bacteroidales bacterium]